MYIDIKFTDHKGEKKIVKGKVNPMDYDFTLRQMN